MASRESLRGDKGETGQNILTKASEIIQRNCRKILTTALAGSMALSMQGCGFQSPDEVRASESASISAKIAKDIAELQSRGFTDVVQTGQANDKDYTAVVYNTYTAYINDCAFDIQTEDNSSSPEFRWDVGTTTEERWGNDKVWHHYVYDMKDKPLSRDYLEEHPIGQSEATNGDEKPYDLRDCL